jgi:hypothetical protein
MTHRGGSRDVSTDFYNPAFSTYDLPAEIAKVAWTLQHYRDNLSATLGELDSNCAQFVGATTNNRGTRLACASLTRSFPATLRRPD